MDLGELAASPDALLAMLQINIALGILYWALKDSRYRDALFDRIVARFREAKVPDEVKRISEAVFREIVLDNAKLQKLHHTVSLWREELPETHDRDIEDAMAAKRFPRPEQVTRPQSDKAKGLPRRYRWYKENWDKRTSIVIATFIPIVLGWFIIFFDGLKAYWILAYAFLLFGQFWVAGNVVSGRHMVSKLDQEFEQALTSVFVDVAEAVNARAVRGNDSPQVAGVGLRG